MGLPQRAGLCAQPAAAAHKRHAGGPGAHGICREGAEGAQDCERAHVHRAGSACRVNWACKTTFQSHSDFKIANATTRHADTQAHAFVPDICLSAPQVEASMAASLHIPQCHIKRHWFEYVWSLTPTHFHSTSTICQHTADRHTRSRPVNARTHGTSTGRR